jgi:hypothetical protein
MAKIDWERARRADMVERFAPVLPVLGSKAPSPRPQRVQYPVGRQSGPLTVANRRPLRTDNGR